MIPSGRSSHPRFFLPSLALSMLALFAACGDDGGSSTTDTGTTPKDSGFIDIDTGVVVDSGVATDAGQTIDTGVGQDAAPADSGLTDSGLNDDAGGTDAGIGVDADPRDASTDAATRDTGLTDGGGLRDTGLADAGLADIGVGDAGVGDAGVGDAGLPDTGTSTTPPSPWTCDPTYYSGADGCDCGCGLYDPDCADMLVGSCDYCQNFGSCSELFGCGAIEATDNSKCITAVCGNGAVEPGETCDDSNTTGGDGCDAQCQIEIPAGWLCDPSYYSDGYCDCGCGALDRADCADATVASCEFCDDPGSCSESAFGCPGYISPTDSSTCAPTLCGDGLIGIGEECDDANTTSGDGCDDSCLIEYVCGDGAVVPGETCDDGNTTPGDGCDAQCQIEVPAGWTCDPSFYGDGLTSPFPSCDCGCGVLDIDCADLSSAVCDYCDDLGSCSTALGCPGTIDPTNNVTCL